MDNRIYEYVTVFIMSWLFVFGLTPFVIKFAYRTNFVDKPEARKMHLSATPLLGGVSVFLGFFILCIYDVAISPGRYFDLPMLGYLAGSVLIVLHDLNFAAAWADHVVAMKAGAVVATGRPEAVLTGPLLSALYDTEIEVAVHGGRPLVLHHMAPA